MGLFSILAAGTHIPPHHGMLNTRLIVHIPLIVPAGCRLRVGNEVREVRAGEPLIFDDTIEHEAWNDSAEPPRDPAVRGLASRADGGRADRADGDVRGRGQLLTP